MFTISSSLSLMLTPIMIIVFVVSLIFSKNVKASFRKERAAISEMNSFLSENLAGIKLTQIFNQEKTKEEQFNIRNEEIRKQYFKIITGIGKVTVAPKILTFDLLDFSSFSVDEI